MRRIFYIDFGQSSCYDRLRDRLLRLIALAEFIRTIIVANTNEGMAAAPRPAPRPPTSNDPGEGRLRAAIARQAGLIDSFIAKLLGISRSTLYKALPVPHLTATRPERLAGADRHLPADTRPGPPTINEYEAVLSSTPAAS